MTAQPPPPGVDDAADELYGVAPDAFVPRRDELAAAARQAGDRDRARAIAALRRPTQSAWLVNLLVRRERAPLEQLLDLGEALRDAQQHLSGDALRELSAQRTGVVSALVRRAGQLAREAGARTSSAALGEVQATLEAALAQPEVAAQVRAGRLVRPVEYAGFCAAPDAPAAAGGSIRTVDKALAEAEAEQDRQREAARRALAEAEAERDRQRVLAQERAGEQAALDERLRDMNAQLRDLNEEVRDLERRLAEARLAGRAALARESAADEAVTQARQALERAAAGTSPPSR